MYFLMGFSLSADAFAITISNLLVYKNSKILKFCPLYFGFFQFLMTFLGYFFANLFSNNISTIGNSISFILLTFIGVKMICDALFKKEEEINPTLSHKYIIIQAIATSIDALATGISLCFMDLNIFYASTIIGFITALMCTFAIFFFLKIPTKTSENLEVLGGIILIFLGIKALF
ncbi:MAG: manganese efflux pump MntP family protein [Clostridia bacterium]